MVNDNKSKTIINNKNIIQICGNLKPKKKQKETNNYQHLQI